MKHKRENTPQRPSLSQSPPQAASAMRRHCSLPTRHTGKQACPCLLCRLSAVGAVQAAGLPEKGGWVGEFLKHKRYTQESVA